MRYVYIQKSNQEIIEMPMSLPLEFFERSNLWHNLVRENFYLGNQILANWMHAEIDNVTIMLYVYVMSVKAYGLSCFVNTSLVFATERLRLCTRERKRLS